jgi:Carboxypeptidase regulatory-like domain
VLQKTRLRLLQTALTSMWLLLSYGVLLGALTRVALASEHSIRSLTNDGKVVDILGRPVAGVRVSLLNVLGVAVGERVTNSAGDYRFPIATAGRYAVIAEKAGFRRSVISVLLSPAGSSIPAIVMESEQPLTMSVRAARLRAQNDLSRTGASKYTLTDHDITNLSTGKYTPLNQVMLQMPGVTLDQNQEIHIRGEHMGIQYQMNGILLPLDINTDPTFTQLLNSFYIKA